MKKDFGVPVDKESYSILGSDELKVEKFIVKKLIFCHFHYYYIFLRKKNMFNYSVF